MLVHVFNVLTNGQKWLIIMTIANMDVLIHCTCIFFNITYSQGLKNLGPPH